MLLFKSFRPVLFFVLLFSAGICHAQLFPRLVGGAGDQTGTGVVQTPDSGYIVCGRQSVNGQNSGLVTYFNKSQNVVWNKVLTVGTDAQLIDIEADTSGIYVYGQAVVGGANCLMLAKLNYAGALIRQQIFRTSSSLVISAQLYKLRDGTLAFTSLTTDGSTSIIYRTDTLFNTLWVRTFAGGSLNQVRGITLARDGGLLIVGGWISSGESAQCFFGKLDVQGNTRWLHTFDGPDMEVGLGICEGDSNEIYVSGYEFSDNRDAFILRADSTGQIRWAKRYHSDQEYFLNVALLPDGNIVCSGDIGIDATGAHLLTLVKYDGNTGAKIWDNVLTGNFNSVTGRGKSLMVLPQGYINILGSADPSFAVAGYDLFWGIMDFNGSGCSSRPVVGAQTSNFPFGGPVGNPTITSTAALQTVFTPIQLSDANFCNKNSCSGTLNTKVLGSDVRICAPSYTIEPEVFPNSTYLWSTNETTPDITVTRSGQYIVRVTSACGSFSDTINVELRVFQVNLTPLRDTLCSGDTARLTASGTAGNQYTWSGSPHLTQIIGSLTSLPGHNISNTPMTITIRLTARDALQVCTPFVRDIPIVVNPLPARPAIDSSGSLTLCNGATVRLIANPASDTLLWTNGVRDTALTVGTSGLFAVRAINRFGCRSPLSDSVRVRVQPLLATPFILNQRPVRVCDGDSVRLTTNSLADSVRWSTGQLGAAIFVRQAGTYSVQAFSRLGCRSAKDSVDVASVSFTVTASPDSGTVCSGNGIRLDALGPVAGTYTWSGSPDLTVTNGRNTILTGRNPTQQPERVVVILQAQDTGRVCPVYTKQIPVTVNPKPLTPVIDSSGPLTICQGDSVTLYAAPGDSLVWSNGHIGDSIVVSQAGTFLVNGLNRYGCTGKYSTPVTVRVTSRPAPPAIRALGPTEFCEGDSVLLTYDGSVQGPRWNNGDTQRFVLVRTTKDVWLVAGWGTLCPSLTSDTIHVEAVRKPRLVVSNDTAICGLDSVRLWYDTDFRNAQDSFWMDEQGRRITSAPAFYYYEPNVEGIPITRLFIAQVTDFGPMCTSRDTVTISQSPHPNAQAGPDASLCPGQSLELGIPTDLSPFAFEWRPSQYLDNAFLSNPIVQNPMLDTNRMMTYMLRKYSPLTGCEDRDTVSIYLRARQGGNFAGPDLELCSGDTATIGTIMGGIPEVLYHWRPLRWLGDTAASQTIIHPILEDGFEPQRFNYVLSLNSWFGACPARDTVVVTVHPKFELRPDGLPYCTDSALFIPNVITPDADGSNDRFHIQTLAYYPDNKLVIYNRWGRQVYTASPYKNGWAGDAPGMYFYRLELPRLGKKYTGWVEVVK